MDLHQLDVLVNDAGVDTSAMRDAVMQLDQNDVKVSALRVLIEGHGQKLSAIQGWSTHAQPVKVEGLPPGMAVGDVGAGNGDWTGPINGKSLSLGNWSYIQKHMGDFSNKWGQVFDGPFTIADASGRLYTAGEVASADPDQYVENAFDLSVYVG